MLRVFIQHKGCRHRAEHNLPDDVTSEEIENLFYGECPDCAEQRAATVSLFAGTQEDGEDEDETAGAGRLPALRGSPKQVAWALGIREEKMQAAFAWIDRMQRQNRFEMPPGQSRTMTVRQAMDALDVLERQETDAHWWIDRREVDIGTLLRARIG